jgi:hypothetical protein
MCDLCIYCHLLNDTLTKTLAVEPQINCRFNESSQFTDVYTSYFNRLINDSSGILANSSVQMSLFAKLLSLYAGVRYYTMIKYTYIEFIFQPLIASLFAYCVLAAATIIRPFDGHFDDRLV